MPDKTTVYSNGILAEDGNHRVVFDPDELYELILAESEARDDYQRRFLEVQTQGRQAKTLGPPPSITPDNLAKARWGIIWPPEPLTEIEKEHQIALARLIDHRHQQMGKEPHQFYYKPGWTYEDFLWNDGRDIESGDMNTQIVPYYLCLIGSPERIPWEFQQYLDGEYAVGRLWFDDPEDCKKYVQHLIEHEKTNTPPPDAREVLFLGTLHPSDLPTYYSATQLVKPLSDWLSQNSQGNFYTSLLLGNQPNAEAYKNHLLQRLAGLDLNGASKAPPVFLFTAGHGMEFGNLTDEQYVKQGALICQEWPGGSMVPQPSHFLAGADLGEHINLSGRMAFCFACYSAGTPLEQDWVQPTLLEKPSKIASKPFVANLPQKLLARGLMCFIGHVSRVWDFSFLGVKRSSQQLSTFSETIGQILHGQPVGHATDYLNARWIQLTVLLDKQIANNTRYTKEDVIATWKARNDCRGYVVLGDPAAKIRI